MSALNFAFISLVTVLSLQFLNIDIVLFDVDPDNPSHFTLLRLGRRRAPTSTTTTSSSNSHVHNDVNDLIRFPAHLQMQLHPSNHTALAADFLLALPHVRNGAVPPSVGEGFIRRGFHLPLTSWLVAALVNGSADAVIDVGAGTGYFAALASALRVKSAATFVFEANPHLCPYLRLSALANAHHHRWSIHCAAVAAASADTVEMFVPRRRWLLTRVYSREDDASLKAPADTLVQVPTLAIDDVVHADTRVALMIVDADNAELGVLAGAQRLLARCQVRDIVLTNLRLSGDVFGKLRAVLALVNRCGYRGFLLTERAESRAPPQPLRADDKNNSGKWQRIIKFMQPWTPGAEWPANKTLWLHVPSTEAERAAMPNQLPESAVASL
jgi:FkbM family methyltransferase